MRKCTVCRRAFRIKKDRVYQVQDVPPQTGVGFLLPAKPTTMDATDCPFCSCQQVLAARLPKRLEETP